MEYTATSNHIHMSTRRLRLIADSVRKLSAAEAIVRLSMMPKVAAKPMQTTIASAVANAKLKGAQEASLRFKKIEVMGGPFMKRWHAVSRGQAHQYKKRMTHVRVILTDEKES